MKNPIFEPITHPFFLYGAFVLRTPDQWTFVYLTNQKRCEFCSWTVDSTPDINTFLDQCITGEHSDKGIGSIGTFADIMNELNTHQKQIFSTN